MLFALIPLLLNRKKFFIFSILGALLGMGFVPTLGDNQLITAYAYSGGFQQQTYATSGAVILIPIFLTLGAWVITLFVVWKGKN